MLKSLKKLFRSEIVALSAIIALSQLPDAYFKFLPFSKTISDRIKRKIFIGSAVWCLISVFLYFFLFNFNGIQAQISKSIRLTGWLPYFLISVPIIRKKLPQHVFIFGMQSLWCFMLHATGGGVVVSIFGAMSEGFLTLQISFYIAFFLILFPLERKFFINLLATAQFFTNRALRWKISLLPLIKAFLRGK